MSKIICYIGTSGSGKSTYAIEECKKLNVRRINRDSIRLSIVGSLIDYYKREDVFNLEKEVTDLQNNQIDYFLERGFDLIIDNTNLKLRYINEIYTKYRYHDIELKKFDVDLETAKRRILKRDFNCVIDDKIITDTRVEYIDKQYNDYLILIEKLDL